MYAIVMRSLMRYEKEESKVLKVDSASCSTHNCVWYDLLVSTVCLSVWIYEVVIEDFELAR